MTPDQFQDCVSDKKWRFAKSMPSIPHEYTRVSEWASKSDFENAVICIRRHGVTESFYRRKYIYLYVGEYKYWTMGAPAHETEIINRAAVDG